MDENIQKTTKEKEVEGMMKRNEWIKRNMKKMLD